MNRHLLKLILVGGCMTAFAAAAGPLQRADVPKDPLWVIHMDGDALKQTTLGKLMLTELEKPEALKKIAAFQAIYNLDPRKDIHGVTLYSTGPTPQDGVLMAYADFDAERLGTLAGGAKDYQSTEHNKHTIHSWTDEHKTGKSRTYSAFVGKRIVFGQKESCVKAALDVLDLLKPNLTTSTEYARLGENSGASFVAAARQFQSPSADINSQVLKHSKMITVSLGENQGRVDGTLKVDADSQEIAQQVQSVGQGLISLLALQADKPEAAKLAEALSIKQEGVTVTVKLSILTDDVVGMVKAKLPKKTD